MTHFLGLLQQIAHTADPLCHQILLAVPPLPENRSPSR
jgi:hypothetical protein